MKHIFISYRRRDSITAAQKIYEEMDQHFPKGTVFWDLDSIEPGIAFRRHIAQLIPQCGVQLVVIGRHWLDTPPEPKTPPLAGPNADEHPPFERRLDDPEDLLRVEIETGLRSGIRVIPVLVEDAALPAPESLPESLQPLVGLNCVTLHPGKYWSSDLEDLLKAVEPLVIEAGDMHPLPVAAASTPAAADRMPRVRAKGHASTVGPLAKLRRPKLRRALIVSALSVLSVTTLVATLRGPVTGFVLRYVHPPTTTGHGAPPAPDAQQVLRVGLTALDTIDPQRTETVSGYEVSTILFPGLVQLDAQLRPLAWAASKIGLSADGLTYTFTVRSNLSWSDGTTINADDFAFAIDRALNPCSLAPTAYFLDPIQDATAFSAEACLNGSPSGRLVTLINDSLVVVDAHTLRIKLQRPAAYFLTMLNFPVSYAIPRTLVTRYGMNWVDHLADNGGLGGNIFKLTSQGSGSLTLARNGRFWGTPAKLREIIFSLYTRPGAVSQEEDMYNDFLAGNEDVSQVAVSQYASASQSSEFHETGQLSMDFLSMNWGVPPFDDLRMRQAFALALNKTQLASDVGGGTVTATNHIVPYGMPGYNQSLLGPDGATNLSGNVQSARALAQGYATLNCGGDLSRCPPIVLAVPRTNPVIGPVLANEIKDMWQQAMPDYPIQVQVLQISDLLTQATSGKLQCWVLGWEADYPDPQDFLSTFFLPTAALNNGHVNLTGATALIQQADVEQDVGARMNNYKQAEQLLVTAVAIVPLFQPKTQYMVRKQVVGYSMTTMLTPSIVTWQQVYIAQS